jgi:hypothetical protein
MLRLARFGCLAQGKAAWESRPKTFAIAALLRARPTQRFAEAAAVEEEVLEGALHRAVGGDEVMDDAEFLADAREEFVMSREFLEVLLPRELRIDVEFATRFDIAEDVRFVEVQIDFSAI